MKNKVIELNGQENYYVIEELEYNNKKYIMCSKTKEAMDQIDTKNVYVCEVDLMNDNIVVKDIENQEEAFHITKMLIDKVQSVNSSN